MRHIITRTCMICADPFPATRRDAVTCGSTCRQRKHRAGIAKRLRRLVVVEAELAALKKTTRS